MDHADADLMTAAVTPRSPAITWRRLVTNIHIVATIALLGADLGVLVLALAGLRGADPSTTYPAAALVATWLVAPLAITALVTGLVLARLAAWGLTAYWWVSIKLAITVVLAALLLFVLVPALAHAASAPAELTDPQRIRFVVAPSVASLLLVFNVALARAKPRWRLRCAEQDEP